MATNVRSKGNVRAGRFLGFQASDNAADRIAFLFLMRRLRACVDLRLGSVVPADEKDVLLSNVLTDIASGRSPLSNVVFASDVEFQNALRCALAEQCQNLLGDAGS